VQQQTRAITLQTVLSTLMVVIIGAGFVTLFTRRFVATPIRELITGTRALSAMQLDRNIEISRRSQELDELVDSFNRMRERLKVAVDDLNEMQQPSRAKWLSEQRNSKQRIANCSRTIALLRFDSWLQASLMKSTILFRECSTFRHCWNG
jgi:HAMP domain-containing protein